ncbi:glycosyltransferase [Plantibacter sp. YIM 135347]|uniref:glycosyltransferase n=1 Tax=Plantibacter sp. YIM 135347 TaxID=3423919 RepID=UPI003D324AE2
MTWGIPDDFGGMTNAMLHRSRAFVRLGGQSVDIVTFDARPDYPQLEARLREQGQLIDGVRIVNLWDWLRSNPLPGGSLKLSSHPFLPLDETDDTTTTRSRDGHVLSRTRHAADGKTVLQNDYYRIDGTLLASDRRDVKERGTLGGRSVVLCDAQGQPVRSWGGVWQLYRSWLDALTAGEQSWMIVDSKTIANFMLTYRRRSVVTAHVVHASHLSGTARPHGTLRESRRTVFEELDKYDAVIVLSERQRQDIEILLGKHKNVRVVPNSRDFPDIPADAAPRPQDRGIFLGSLTARKRPEHAIRALAAARTPAGASVSLDLYGGGELTAAMETVIEELGAAAAIRLHGHDPAARDRLLDWSFLVMTSTSEGFPLVLVESLAAGCLPIVYDIPYGPADIIRDGWNGYLVPDGDQAAVTAAVERLLSLPQAEVERMRANARSSARRFSDEEVTREWAAELQRAARRKRVKPSLRA